MLANKVNKHTITLVEIKKLTTQGGKKMYVESPTVVCYESGTE